jgi:hypothetical protein
MPSSYVSTKNTEGLQEMLIFQDNVAENQRCLEENIPRGLNSTWSYREVHVIGGRTRYFS